MHFLSLSLTHRVIHIIKKQLFKRKDEDKEEKLVELHPWIPGAGLAAGVLRTSPVEAVTASGKIELFSFFLLKISISCP